MKKTDCFDKKKWHEKIIKIQILAIAGFVALIFVGCSGGSSGNGAGVDSSIEAASLVEGVFVDSPVEGLDYMTDTYTGITDIEGRFTCFEGEMITFMIGDVMLGQAMAGEVITPMDFLDESEMPFDVTHPMVTNMGRFLQSLDSDGDPENGITISEEVKGEITGRMIDFHQSIEDFENDSDVVACFDVLNGLNMPHNGLMWDLFSTDEARKHMIEHMGEYMGFVASEKSGSDAESPMDDEMVKYMNDHMGFDATDDSDGDFEHPMDGFMDEEMEEIMEEHMGFGFSDDSDSDFEHPMEEFMDDEMFEYMESRMGGGMGSRM